MCYLAALELTSLEPLSKISGLKVLDVSENPALSWRGYSAPSTLVELFAARSGLEDLSALRHARALEEVLLAENLGLSDLDVLADMPSLRQIDVKLTSVRDLAPLRHAEKLVALYCDFCPALDSLDALSGMRSLEIFSCEGTERELDLRPLLALPRLTRVVIDKNAGAKMRGVCAELGRRGVAIELGGEATPRG
jgi:Leucine-rich repeat (LRR) protein